MSQIRISDGAVSVDIDQHATLTLAQNFANIEGGSLVQRFLDGSGQKQTHWASTKRRITVTGNGVVPPRVGAIDYSLPLTLTLRDPADTTPDGPGTEYRVFADPPAENWDINAARFTWTLIGVEQ